MRKRGTVNRKDTAKMRGRKTVRIRARKGSGCVLLLDSGRMMRGRLIMRDGPLALVRIV